MAEVDFDVEAMLEAPYRKDDENHTSYSPPHTNGGSGSGTKERSNGKRKESHRSRSRSRDRRHSRDDIDIDLAETNCRGYDEPPLVVERERRRSRDRDRERDRDRDREPREKKRSDRSAVVEKKRSKSRERRERRRSRTPPPAPSSRTVERKRSRSRDRGGKREVRKRSRSRDRERERERDRRPRSKSIERRRSRSRDRRRSRSRDRRRRSPSPRPFRRGRTPPNSLGHSPPKDLTPEERDARTVFCMQLSQRIRARDLEEFFSSVGKVRDVRLITCNKTKRFKGIAYIEFKDPESVPLALGLSGQRLLGVPISVQHTQAEKNRLANISPPAAPIAPPKITVGPMRLYVGSLHFNITEDMLRGIFEPFGKIDSIQLIMDPETQRSKGYGFITFHNSDDAKKALEQLNGFELAGRPMKVGNVTERLDMNTNASLDTDEMDRSGIDLGATGRLQLMFKLAEGAGLAVPQAAANALLATVPQPAPQQPVTIAPPIATQCFLLSNMFDPQSETNPTWDTEIHDDVIEECNKHGGVLHIYVDTASPQGNVYVKCSSIATAVLAVNSLHGRWFAGRMITAAYVPLVNYHALFPDALTALSLLHPARTQN